MAIVKSQNNRDLIEAHLEEGDEIEVCFVEAAGCAVLPIVWSWPAVVVAEGDHFTLRGEERSVRLGSLKYDCLTERFSKWKN